MPQGSVIMACSGLCPRFWIRVIHLASRHLRALPVVPSRRLVTLRFHLRGGGLGGAGSLDARALFGFFPQTVNGCLTDELAGGGERDIRLMGRGVGPQTPRSAPSAPSTPSTPSAPPAPSIDPLSERSCFEFSAFSKIRPV